MSMSIGDTTNRQLDDVSILVNSCDKYADLWPVFFALFWRYWPDCPYPVYLGSNSLEYNHPRVRMITVGPDRSWAETTRKMLEAIPSPYVLWFLDDFFLVKRVDTEAVRGLVEEMKELDANYLRLRPAPPAKAEVPGHPFLRMIVPGAEYRCSLGIALWRRRIFLKLLKDGETAWEMEKAGSERSETLDGFYTTRETVIERTNGLEAGKWLRYNLPLLRREGLAIPPGHPVMTRSEHAARWMRENVSSPVLNTIYTVVKLIRKAPSGQRPASRVLDLPEK
jgi:hypothetical protein